MVFRVFCLFEVCIFLMNSEVRYFTGWFLSILVFSSVFACSVFPIILFG